jgi:hypothetical protein
MPNVLMLVNHDDNSRFADLLETVTGRLDADSGETCLTNMHIATRLGDKRKRIDLYCWIDDYRRHRRIGGWLMTEAVPEHTAVLRTLLVNVLPRQTLAVR